MAYCPNGHYYNAALHDSCPECAKSAGKTEAVGSAGGFSKTEKVGGGYSGGRRHPSGKRIEKQCLPAA